MRKSIAMLLGEAEGKMSGYVALTNYRYMNLCVKAEPASLLGVNIELNDTTFNMEDVADVARPQEDQFAIYPKDRSEVLIVAICKGVKAVHPEFKVDIKDMDDEDGDEEVENDDIEDKYILLTMPEINDDRHDVIIDGVDTLQKECLGKLDALMEAYTQKFSIKLQGADVQEMDEAKDALKEIYDNHKKLLDEYSDGKKEEVEEAYQRYLEEQEAKEQEKQEEEAAHNEEVSQRMSMEEPEDNEY